MKGCTLCSIDGSDSLAHAATESAPRLRGVSLLGRLWRPGKILNVAFFGGSKTLRLRVATALRAWTKYANVKFTFNPLVTAEIRIAFRPDQGAWSFVGTDALGIVQENPTMNLGWLTDETPDNEVFRVVAHEGGHALGLVHEHGNPVGGIPWNKEAVYAWYAGPPNYWNRGMVDSNVFQVYDRNQVRATALDRDSIMMYPIDPSWTTNGYSVGWNMQISKGDQAFVGQLYPYFGTKKLAVGATAIVLAQGLNVRAEADLQSSVLTVARRDQTGIVQEGGVKADGIIWWKISFDSNVTGWCAEKSQGGLKLLGAL